MPFGYGVLFLLTTLSVITSAAVVVRMQLATRAERFVAMAMVWNALVIVPIYALGFTSLLYRGALAAVATVWFLAVLALTIVRSDYAMVRDGVIEALFEVLATPRDAVRECLRKGSWLVAGAVFFAIALSIWTAIQSWYLSSWGQWDALWYHEPMIGWAIQNHGFDVVPLPMSAQKTNGYPRLVEMTQLWWVIFTDRRLLEIMNSVFGPVLAVGTYALCRRYTKDRVAAMGWGACLLVSPFVSNLLQTIYVDIQYAAFVVAAIYFASQKPLRMRDALLVSVCLTLAIGSKSMALVPVPILAFLTLGRLVLEHRKTRKRAIAGVALAGVAMIGLMASATYVKNWIRFKNPLWPDVKVDIERFGIHWPGSVPMYGAGPRVDLNIPFPTLVGDLTMIPYTKTGSPTNQDFDYGFAFAYLIVPMSVLAMLVAFVVLGRPPMRWLWSKIRKRPYAPLPGQEADLARVRNLLFVAFVGFAMLWTSPALWGARYNISAVACMMAACAWLGGRRGLTRLGHGAATFAAMSSVIMCVWVVPRWYAYPHELWKLHETRYPEREVTPASRFAPGLWIARGSSVTKDVGLARERELGKDKIILINDSYGNYPAHFWNLRYSNKVIYVPSGEMLQEAERLGATWIFLANGDGLTSTVRAPNSGWQEVGTLNVEGWGTVYRRVR